jgi:hypothetical protein
LWKPATHRWSCPFCHRTRPPDSCPPVPSPTPGSLRRWLGRDRPQGRRIPPSRGPSPTRGTRTSTAGRRGPSCGGPCGPARRRRSSG